MTEQTDGRTASEIEDDIALDKVLKEAKDDGRILRYFVVAEDGWEIVDDPRTDDHGLVNALLMVAVPDGSYYFCMPAGASGGIYYRIGSNGCLNVHRAGASPDDDGELLMTFGTAGWYNIRNLQAMRT